MKIKKYLSIIALGALALSACSEDYYNGQFEGLEQKTEITDIQRGIEYVLADGDYKTIAENETNKSLAAEAGETEALAAISTNKSFAYSDQAAKYIPAFLAAQSGWYHLSAGSQILVTAKVAETLPEAIASMKDMKSYTLTSDDYKTIWGSEEDFIDAVTPATVSKLISGISTEGLEAGDYVAVTYKYAESEPVFSAVGGGSTGPKYVYKPVAGPVGEDGKYLLVAAGLEGKYYAATCVNDSYNNGYGYSQSFEVTISDGMIIPENNMVEDNSGRNIENCVFLLEPASGNEYYLHNEYDDSYYYLTDYASFSYSSSANEKEGSYTYVFADADGGATTEMKNVGANKVFVFVPSKKQWNMYASLAETDQVYPKLYRREEVEAAAAYAAETRSAVSTPASANKYAIYKFDGSKLSAADAAVVQPSDYTAMGQTYGSFTDPAQDTYLPMYLIATFPYAMEGDVKNVVFRKYANSTTTWDVDEYKFNGSEWVKNDFFAEVVSAFRKVDGKNWAFDPTLEIDYSVMGTDEFKAFCQYCANWVYDNIEVPLGAPARDNAGEILDNTAVKVGGANLTEYCFFDYRGNAEYFAGTYSYYGEIAWNTNYAMDDFKKAAAIIKETGVNVDLGIDVDKVLGGATGAEIVKAMQNNAGRVFAEVLGLMYPDVTPDDYAKCVVKVYNYTNRADDGITPGVYQCTINIVGTGKFEFVQDSFERAE